MSDDADDDADDDGEGEGEVSRKRVSEHCNDRCKGDEFCVRVCTKHKFRELANGELIADMHWGNKVAR